VSREGLTIDRYLRHTIVISNGDQWDRNKTQLFSLAHIGGAFILTFLTAYAFAWFMGIVQRQFKRWYCTGKN
jgi:hypothetical protein